jgi:hypothetical protein
VINKHFISFHDKQETTALNKLLLPKMCINLNFSTAASHTNELLTETMQFCIEHSKTPELVSDKNTCYKVIIKHAQ